MYMDPAMFWGTVLALVAVGIALYFLGRQAILDALEEHDKRKRAREENERTRRGGRL